MLHHAAFLAVFLEKMLNHSMEIRVVQTKLGCAKVSKILYSKVFFGLKLYAAFLGASTL